MEDYDDLGWHAMNYRTAASQHAEGLWQELSACVERRVAAAIAEERERCWKVGEWLQDLELKDGNPQGAAAIGKMILRIKNGVGERIGSAPRTQEGS